MVQTETEAACAKALAGRAAAAYAAVLDDVLAGIYLHGSLALDSFHWATGDIDFLVVTSAPPSAAQKEELIRILLSLDPEAPAKGFEMSVVLRRYCGRFVFPTPYELHFSNMHKAAARADPAAYCARMHGVDADLAVHFALARQSGITLWGEAARNVFAPVPERAYLAGVLQDLEASVRTGPIDAYAILNLCRTLAYLQSGHIVSKEQGGRFVLAQAETPFHPIVRAAMAERSADVRSLHGNGQERALCLRVYAYIEAQARARTENQT